MPPDTLARRAPTSGVESRNTTVTGIEVRAAEGDAFGFRGHAAVFDSRTWIGPKMWGFNETVARGAFSKSIGEADVRFLINHDANLVLARTTAGTLRLSEDAVGLAVDADLARTSYGNDLAISLQRGDVTQMSFAFEVIREEWSQMGDGSELRTILEARLWDVSAVTYPAYDDTDAQLRSQAFDALCHTLGLTTRKRSKLIAAFEQSTPDPDAVAVLRDAHAHLASLLEAIGPATATPEPELNEDITGPATATRGSRTAGLMRRHQLNASRYGITPNKEN
jgi:HK97 family phage prohead protease